MSKSYVDVLDPFVLRYKWEINNFLAYSTINKNYPIITSKFSTISTHAKEVYWKWELYPNGLNINSENYVSIFVYNIETKSIKGNITFSILDIDNKIIYELTLKNQSFEKKIWHGFQHFKERTFIFDENNHVLENGTLKIMCEINFDPALNLTKQLVHCDVSSQVNNSEESNYRLKEFDDFEKLLESETFSDMTFVVEDKKIHAHKAVLISRSPVFEVMLQHYINEKQENIFEITDIKYEVMKELLRFLYAGKVNDIKQQAPDLLKAADKYSITGLKALCEKVLYENLTIDNALEYLNLAAACDAIQLKAQVIEFIASNLENIVKKPEFELFGDLHSKVICEVVRAIAKNNLK